MTRVEMEQLIRHLSHEVKNPLTTLKGYAQLASLKKNDSEFVDKALGIISGQIERIEKIFNDLYGVYFYTKNPPVECNVMAVFEQILKSTDSIHVTLSISPNMTLQTDDKLLNRLISMVTTEFDWKTHKEARCVITSTDNDGKQAIVWDFEGVDFFDIRKKLLYMPFSEKNYYPSGVALYEAFCVADMLGFSFDIDPVKNRFILSVK